MTTTKKPKKNEIRNRIREYKVVPAKSLIINPANIQRHSKEQSEAMLEILQRVGLVVPYVVREKDGGYLLLDGELRTGHTRHMDVPVVILNDDVTDEEAAIILSTFNPVGSLATSDQEALRKLVEGLQADDAVVDNLLKRIHGEYESKGVELKSLEPPDPPKRSWVLIGVPTVQYGEIQRLIDTIANIPGVLVETTVTD